MKAKLLYLFIAVFFLNFSGNAQVSLTGPGAAGGWGDGFDIDLTDAGGGIWTGSAIVMPGGEFKFRLDHAWTTNWGAVGWPSGTGTQNGPNITAIAGTYDVTFNQATGEYTFSGGAPISVVNLIGTAVAAPTAMTTTDGITYTLSNATLLDGTAQFEIDGSALGGDTFPTGLISDPGLFIPVPAGSYTSVSVNIVSGDYSFVAAPIYPVISITGIAVGGWGDGFDFDMTTTDGITYTYKALVVDGTSGSNELKFRTNHDWNQPNYGGSGFPTGNATTTGPNIACTASGTYDVTFNLTTGDYTFSFPLISLTGAAFGGWGDGFDFDMTTTDGANYSLASITAVATDGGKFRSNHNWGDPNYGSTSFPAGIALTTTGDNIPVVAGTYGVTFNRVTGEFLFDAPFATTTFNAGNFKVYPNPTTNVWNFTSVKQNIETIQIVDVLGKTVMTIAPKNMTTSVDASSLTRGIYFAKIGTANATETVKLMKN